MHQHNVRFSIHLQFCSPSVHPDVRLSLDEDVLLDGPQNPGCTTVVVEKIMHPGSHLIQLQFRNKCYDTSADDQDMAVIVESLKFQYLDHEFNIYSHYRPQYPEIWLEQQQANQVQMPEVIHGNYLGWNGTWWIDFETPIYRWIHQKLDLGWLI